MDIIEIGITEENRKSVAKVLNKLLADEYVLTIKTKNYHWNMTGIHFRSLHEFLDELYKKGDEFIDAIAERVRTVGEKSLGSMQEFLAQTKFEEDINIKVEPKNMLQNLLKDHESLIREIRTIAKDCEENFSDTGTTDFLVGLLQEHEKISWMIRSHLV